MSRIALVVVAVLGIALAARPARAGLFGSSATVAEQVDGRVVAFTQGGVHSELESWVDLELVNHGPEVCHIEKLSLHGPRGSFDVEPTGVVVPPNGKVDYRVRQKKLIGMPGEQGVVQVWKVRCGK